MAEIEKPKVGGSFLRGADGRLHQLGKNRSRKSFAEVMDETLAADAYSASAVFDRLREALGCESDAALAWIFGTSPQALSNKRKRNAVPYREAVFVAAALHVSLTYLLTGQRES